jgi:hypothetical protein
MIVPVKYTPFSSGTSFLPETGDYAYLTWMSIKVLPISVANYQTHTMYSFFPTLSDHNLDNMTGAGWLQLLLELTAVHNLEDPTGNLNYYGLVNSFDAHGCESGCISGVSNQGATGGLLTGVGWSGFGAGTVEAGQTLVHELGHNFGRPHVNCTGTEPKPDINYPYQAGLIGQWGLDISEGLLYNPLVYGDFMSYCSDVWTSDYNFWNIYSYRVSQSNRPTGGLPIKQTLYISGYRTPTGQVQLEPIYEQNSPLPAYRTGPYRVEMLGDQGKILAAYPFQMSEVADINGYASFGFFVPAIDDLQGIRILDSSRVLVEKVVPEQIADFPNERQRISPRISDGVFTFNWDGIQYSPQEIVYRLRVSQDRGRSWQVLALKLKETSFTLPINSGLDIKRAIFEVQATNGIHTSTTTVSTYGE